jgi:DNA-binding NarL/FixJ family response regulator
MSVVDDEVSFTRFQIGAEQFAVVCIHDHSPGTLAKLTAAENSVASAVLSGRSNRDIALARRTSLRTVANQVAALYRKLGVGSRAELALLCSATGPRVRSVQGLADDRCRDRPSKP